MSYRSDIDALDARHTALGAERAEKQREVDAAARALEAARERARLPVLDNIRVATPCRADWNDMVGDDRVRACAQCDKQVFQLSGMTRAEAEALIVEKNGDLCVRYYQRADGTILLADCSVGGAAARRRKLIAAGAAALFAGGVALALVNRPHREPAFDSVSVAASPESTSAHVSGAEHEGPPPPKPIQPPAPPEPPPMPVMGKMAFHSSAIDL